MSAAAERGNCPEAKPDGDVLERQTKLQASSVSNALLDAELTSTLLQSGPASAERKREVEAGERSLSSNHQCRKHEVLAGGCGCVVV